MLRFKDSQKDALRDVFGKFYFWGDGFYPYEGRLDEILANSSRLRNCVITVLVEVGEILCNEKTGIGTDLGCLPRLYLYRSDRSFRSGR